MEKPLVSIITPAYNCKKTIRETYDSIRKQTYNSWEWIVIEDHSNDDSFEYIQNIISNDKRVVLLRTPENSGAAIARNIGIENAKGRYIAFLDADDLWKEEKLARQIIFMKENKCAFSFSNYDLLYSDGKIKEFKIKNDTINYRQLLKTNFIGCLTAMYDTEILGKVYMPLDCVKREDHGAWLDITKNGILAYRINESLSVYRIANGTVSSNKFKMFKFQYRLYRKHENFNFVKSLWYSLICSTNKILKKY